MIYSTKTYKSLVPFNEGYIEINNRSWMIEKLPVEVEPVLH